MIIKSKIKQNNINIEPDCYRNINNINIDINNEILKKLDSKKGKNEIIYIIKNTNNSVLANKIINYLDRIDYVPNIIIINYRKDIPVFYLKTFFVINNINNDFSTDFIIKTLIANKKKYKMIIKRNNIVCNNKITESNKLYAILICKIFNTADFKLWLNWYINFIKCDHIYIINDNSSIDIKALIKPFENKITLLNLNEIKDIENKNDLQTHTYNKIIFNYIKPNINDIIITPDSDEFWWYDYDKFTSFKKCISDEFDKINEETLLIANILMCNNYFLNSRSQEENFNDISKYRCNIVSAEHKPIIRFNNNKIIHFHLGTKSNHFLTNKHLWLANFYGSGVLYDYHLRLYHYRLTTTEEYNQKLINTLIKYEITNGKRFYMANDINDFMKKSYSNDNKEEDLKYSVLDLTINNTIQKFLK